MKTTLIRSFVLSMLASSISAFAQTAPAPNSRMNDPQTSDHHMSAPCAPGEAGSSKKAAASKHEKKMKENKMQKDQDQKQENNDPALLGIYG